MEWRSRRYHDGDVMMRQVLVRSVQMIGQERTADASFPELTPPHEVIHDELTAVSEQFGKGLLSIGCLEDIFLVDFDPGQARRLLVHCVARMDQLFFLFKQTFRAAVHLSRETTG
jgi:hypothetical protein